MKTPTNDPCEDTTTYSTAHWRLALPKAWTFEPSKSGESYFESPDHSIGIYLRTVQPKHQSVSPIDHLKGVMSILKRNLAPKSKGWRVVDEAIINDTPQPEAYFEAIDIQNIYRIYAKGSIFWPFSVMISYHDYCCEDIAASRATQTNLLASFTTGPTSR